MFMEPLLLALQFRVIPGEQDRFHWQTSPVLLVKWSGLDPATHLSMFLALNPCPLPLKPMGAFTCMSAWLDQGLAAQTANNPRRVNAEQAHGSPIPHDKATEQGKPGGK